MDIFRDLNSWQTYRQSLNGSLGFVPTMGALHAGHLSLMQQSLNENSYTLVSIFVNPTQFDQQNDFEKYPSHLERDIRQLKNLGVHAVLLPTYEQIYPDHYTYKVTESTKSQILCGKSRKGHFDGVLTIVLKLLNLAKANKAYFGKKDFQQYLLIRDMAAAFFLDTEIIACEILREDDGLAMSSRNLRLTPQQRQIAAHFYQTLSCDKPIEQIIPILNQQGFEVDYIEEHFGRRLGAVQLGDIRLIDNVEI